MSTYFIIDIFLPLHPAVHPSRLPVVPWGMKALASYRPLTASDVGFLWTALYHALYVAPGDDPLPPGVVHRPEIARYVEGWMRSGDSGVLASVGESLVGAAWLRRWTGTDRGYGFVDEQTPELSIALLPAWRRRGIGTMLLGRVLTAADVRGESVSLSVSADNPALRLYLRAGFVVADGQGGSVTMLRRCGG